MSSIFLYILRLNRSEGVVKERGWAHPQSEHPGNAVLRHRTTCAKALGHGGGGVVSNTETAGQLSPRWMGEDMEQDEVAGKAVPCTQERGTQL